MKSFGLLASTSLFLTCASMALSQTSADLSVGPLHLGMSPQEVQAALATDYMQTGQLHSPDPQGGMAVSYQKRGSVKDKNLDTFVVQFVNQKVFLIDREILFPVGAQPSLTQTNQRILDKYGPPDNVQNDHVDKYWEWDMTGARVNAPGCSPDVVRGSQSFARMDGIAGPVATSFRKGCAVGVKAYLTSQSQTDLLTTMHITIEDQRPMLQYIAVQQQHQKQLQQQKEDNAKKVQAPL